MNKTSVLLYKTANKGDRCVLSYFFIPGSLDKRDATKTLFSSQLKKSDLADQLA